MSGARTAVHLKGGGDVVTGCVGETPEVAGRGKLAVIGVGNPLAGDDGVGVYVVERLAAVLPEAGRLLWGTLQGDLLAVADWLPRVSHLVFVDAVAGALPGQIVTNPAAVRAWAPSFHQTDLASTLDVLGAMGVADPMPTWEIWGVTIEPPAELGEGLSPAVAKAVDELIEQLATRLRVLLEVVPGREDPDAARPGADRPDGRSATAAR